MASGDTLVVFTPLHASPPSSVPATLDERNNHLVLDFDVSVDEYVYFEGFMPRNYDGGGITITSVWMASSATSGDVKIETALERHQDDVDDLDSDSFAAGQSAVDVCASASGETAYTATTHTDGAQMDSVVAGESFRLKFGRIGSKTDQIRGEYVVAFDAVHSGPANELETVCTIE